MMAVILLPNKEFQEHSSCLAHSMTWNQPRIEQGGTSGGDRHRNVLKNVIITLK